MNKNKDIWIPHVDSKWIDKKIGGHGGCYGFNTTKGIVIIDYIGGKNHIQLFWYNTILFVRFLVRKVVENGKL